MDWVTGQSLYTSLVRGKPAIPTYERALDSGLLLYKVYMERRSEGGGIPTYKGALALNMLPCRGMNGCRTEGAGIPT